MLIDVFWHLWHKHLFFSGDTHISVRPDVPLWDLNSSRKEPVNDQIHFDFTKWEQPAEFSTTSQCEGLKTLQLTDPFILPVCTDPASGCTKSLLITQMRSLFCTQSPINNVSNYHSFSAHVSHTCMSLSWATLKGKHVSECDHSWKVWGQRKQKVIVNQ